MPKISSYPLATPAAGDSVLGIQADGDVVRFPALDATNERRILASGMAKQGLRRFRTALSARNTTPVDIVHIGDSITWGFKAGLLSQRWGSVLNQTLRLRYQNTSPVVGGAGFISARQQYGPIVFPDAQISRTGGADASQNFGPDQNGFVMSASGDKIVFTFTGTGFDFFYAQYPGGGTFSFKLDAGVPVNVNSNGGTNFAAKNQTIRGLAMGVHTVELAWVSGTCYATGGFGYNGDEAAGIRSWILSHPGTTSSYWWDTSKNYWLLHFNNINPALVTLELGSNDFAGPVPVSPSVFKSNLQNIISEIKARCSYPPSFVICPTWPLVPSGTPLAPWQSYVDDMYDIALTDADRSVCIDDWQDRTSSNPGTTIGGILDADSAHPNPTGNRYLGETLATFIQS